MSDVEEPAREDPTREQVIRAVLAAAGSPSEEQWAHLRAVLPPVQ